MEAPKVAHKKIYEKMESLEAQKADMEVDMSRLRIAHNIQLTEADVLTWLKQFCAGDPMDMEYHKRIIDVFINSVYLYDDRVITFYNIRGGKQVSFIDLASADYSEEYGCSDLEASAPPKYRHPPVRVPVFCVGSKGIRRERCKKTCRWHVFPATRPVRRRANPLPSATSEEP